MPIEVTPRVLCIVNSESSGPRRLADWLAADGIEVVETVAAHALPADLKGFHGMVVLGGGFMPTDFVRAPWLVAERSLMTQAIEADLPTLGICLGAQLLASVAGGEVRAQYGPTERGSTRIHLTAAGHEDAVLGSLGSTVPMIENHEDMITRLPENAVLLASSDAVANQAFVIGRNVRGVQFHPEVGAADLDGWNDAAFLGDGYDAVSIRVAAEAVDSENTRASRALVRAFGEQVRDSAEHPGGA